MYIVKTQDGSVTDCKDITPAKWPQHEAEGWIQVRESPKPMGIEESKQPGDVVNFGGAFSVLPDGGVVMHWNVSTKPYASWSWSPCDGWVAPVPMPDDGQQYGWDEESQSWVVINEPA